jgi:hypothetical protein
MNYLQNFPASRWSNYLAALTCFVLMAGMVGTAAAQNVVKVEEDWELVVSEPDVPSVGPQVTTSMSPYNSLNDTYFTFEINHKSVPAFESGGLHVHLWNGEERIATFSRLDQATMSTNNEVVTWTQSLEAANNKLKFEVKNGMSSTWLLFGYSGQVKVDRTWPPGHVNNYTPSVSVAQSGVGFASNRVTSLKLLRIRLYLSDGEVLHDNNVRVIFQQ